MHFITPEEEAETPDQVPVVVEEEADMGAVEEGEVPELLVVLAETVGMDS